MMKASRMVFLTQIKKEIEAAEACLGAKEAYEMYEALAEWAYGKTEILVTKEVRWVRREFM